MTSGPYLRVEDVMVLFGWSKRTVHEKARLGLIPHRRLSGTRRLQFIKTELQQWMADGVPLERVELSGGGRIVRPAGSSRETPHDPSLP